MPQRQIGEISESLEDYLEIIAELLDDAPVARVKAIAARKGVSQASVTGALKRLAREGLVRYQAREYVELTPEGAELGQRLRHRHALLSRFLLDVLRVDPAVAETDACGLEHHLSRESAERLFDFFDYLDSNAKTAQAARRAFRRRLASRQRS